MLNIKNEFLKRLLVSTIAIVVISFLIGFAYHPWGNLLLVLTIAVLTAVGVWEYSRLAQAKGIEPAQKWMVAVAIVEILAFYAALAYPAWAKLALPIIVLGFISFFVAHFRKSENALLHVAVEFFGVCYLSIPFSFILAILYPPVGTMSASEDGRFWLFYLIAVTKITDIGGYFVGKLFGKHPLAPALSPKKTIEGAIGGFCFAIAMSLFLFSMTFGMEGGFLI